MFGKVRKAVTSFAEIVLADRLYKADQRIAVLQGEAEKLSVRLERTAKKYADAAYDLKMSEEDGEAYKEKLKSQCEQTETFAKKLSSLDGRYGVGVAVFIRRPSDGKILMLKRQGSHGAGEWSIPGGTIERHDLNVIAAAAREAMEEVGIAIVNPKVLPYFTDNHWDDDGKAFITIYVVADFGEDCGGENPRVCEPSKASQLRWVDPAKMPHPLFLPLNNIAALGVDFSALYDGPFIDTLAQDMKRLALLEGAYREPVDLETTRKKAKSETVTTEWLVARVLSLADQVENLRGWLERDRTGLASSLSLIKQTANAYRWRANDTAPFATLTALVDEVTAIAERGLRASGDRVTEGFYQRPSAPYAVPSCESALVSALASPDAIDAICESAWNRSVEGNVGLKWKGVSSEYRAASRAGVVAVLQCVLSLSEDRGQTDDSTQEGTAS